MPTRKWRHYLEPGEEGIKFGKFASGGYDMNLVKANAANMAQARRNVLGIITNLSGTVVCSEGGGNKWTEWIKVPLGQRIVRPGTLTFQFYMTLGSELGANTVHIMVICGGDVQVETTTGGGALFVPVTVTLSPGQNADNFLHIKFKTEGSNTLTIESVTAYQPGIAGSADFVDLDDANCVLGDPDYPDDVFAMKLLRDNVAAVRGWKVPRGNVFCHNFTDDYIVTQGAFENPPDSLGAYKFLKRKGISQITINMIAGKEGGNVCEIRSTLAGAWAAAPTEGAAQDTTITNLPTSVLGDIQTKCGYAVEYTFANAADIAAELELSIMFTGRDVTAGTEWVGLFGVQGVESEPSAAITHDVPNVDDVGQGSDILAEQLDDIRTTCNHLYYHGGRQILFSDWRHNDQEFKCIDNAFDNRQWYSGPIGYGSVIARAINFSSLNSKRLRIRMGYYTSAINGAASDKELHFCTTKVIDGVHGPCDHIDANPMYDDEADGPNDHIFTDIYDGAEGRPSRREEACFLDIAAGDQEVHWSGAAEPAQVLLQGITADAAEYIIPTYIFIEEAELDEVEFP